MSGVFEQREESFEQQFVISEEVRFKARARRNKLVGLWAARLLGYEGEAAKARADALVEAQVGRGDDGALAAELRGELFARRDRHFNAPHPSQDGPGDGAGARGHPGRSVTPIDFQANVARASGAKTATTSS